MSACPICAAPSAPPSSPFCSPRCKLVDLSRWLSEAYTIPAEPSADDLLADELEAGDGPPPPSRNPHAH
jgi:endogenous inhibitor of DNA gyrase (YacG/DUF329 family)